MTWDASLADMQKALDGRFVDLRAAIDSAETAVNCYSYAEGIDAFDRLVKLAEEARGIYEAMEDKEMEMTAAEYEKQFKGDK